MISFVFMPALPFFLLKISGKEFGVKLTRPCPLPSKICQQRKKVSLSEVKKNIHRAIYHKSVGISHLWNDTVAITLAVKKVFAHKICQQSSQGKFIFMELQLKSQG